MQLFEKPSRVQLDNILLVTEYPPWADVAVPYALGLAREHRARMHVVHPASAHTLQTLTHVPQGGAFREAWRDLLFSAAARQLVVDSEMMPVRVREMTHRHDFDLIVVSLGRVATASKGALGGALAHVFNGAGCPVLVIGPAVDGEVPPKPEPATVLHATDFSPHALAAAQHAFSWAQEYQSWITLLHVVDGIGNWSEPERERVERPFREWMQELVPTELPIWCEVEHRVAFGKPGEEIVRAAGELHADLIAIGLTGMDAVTQHGPGATALEVITRAPCPVLVVRDYMKRKEARPAARHIGFAATAA
ncbi:MAG TPA: universal stress protein [Terriglobales bacterium]|nr:universal stress protein [Terriglobales bacterium]